jgi:hypothetical protein
VKLCFVGVVKRRKESNMRQLLFALFIAIATPRLLACSCALPPAPKVAMAQSTAVFSGKVTKVEQDAKAHTRTVTIEVDRTWKGSDKKTLVVLTAGDGAACGVSFEKDKSYLVYANAVEEKLHASLCSRTKPLEQAKADLDELGEGKKPTKD